MAEAAAKPQTPSRPHSRASIAWPFRALARGRDLLCASCEASERMNAPRLFYGWVVVGVSFLSIAFSRGIQLAFAIFFVEMVQEFGWSRGSTAFFQSTNLAIAGSLGLAVGLLVDRWGSRKTLLLGCGLYALGLVGASTITSQPALLLWWGIVAGMGSALLGFVPLGVVLSHWFVQRRGTAVGLGFAGAGVGTFLLLPATELFIQVTSWRRAMQALALLLVLVLAPIIARFLRESPQEMGLEPDGEAAPEPAATAATAVTAPQRKTPAQRRGALPSAERLGGPSCVPSPRRTSGSSSSSGSAPRSACS